MRKVYSLILVIITVAAVFIGIHIHLGGNKGKVVESEFEYAGDVKSVEIEAAFCDVVIKEGGDTKVTYKGYENLVPDCTYDANSKTLKIKQGENNGKYENVKAESTLTIVFPEGVTLADCDIDLACGNIIFDELRADDVSIEANMGNFEVKNITATSLDITAGMGNVEIGSCNATEVDVEASLGNVTIGMENDINDYSITADAALGRIKIGGKNYKSSYKQTGSLGTMIIDCSLGDVVIE